MSMIIKPSIHGLLVRPRTWFHLKRLFQSGSKLSSFDEDELRRKFQSLGKGQIKLEKNDGVAVVTICNPERKNALTGFMMVRLAEIVDELEAWSEGKALILHGDQGTFGSGADLSVVKAIQTPEEGNQMCAFMQRTLIRLRRLPLVSVAAVQGVTLGGGAELATACDFRLLSKDAELRYVQARMGLSTGWGGGARLVKLVGRQKALEILLKSRPLNLEACLAYGLADGVLSGNKDPVSCSREWLSPYITNHPSVVKAIKGVVAAGDDLTMDEALQLEREIFSSVWAGQANKEALSKKIKHK